MINMTKVTYKKLIWLMISEGKRVHDDRVKEQLRAYVLICSHETETEKRTGPATLKAAPSDTPLPILEPLLIQQETDHPTF